MTRRHVVQIAILGVLAATVAILVLNHLEVDDYPDDKGSFHFHSEPPTWLMQELKHPCETCTTCVHLLTLSESTMAATVTDRDGWYRLFWAGAETYTYDDPAYLGGALRNRTAELSGGSWTLRGAYMVWIGHPPHACTPVAKDFELRYRLRRGPFPGPGDPALDPSGTLAVPARLLWFRFPFPPDRVDDFWWELENPDTFAGTKPMPCTCGLMPAQEQK